MGLRVWLAWFVVIGLANHAHGQPPSQQPPTDPPPPAQPDPNPPPPSLPQQPSGPPQVAPLPAQKQKQKQRHTICFAGRPLECASVLLLEVGARGGDRQRAVASANFGLLIHDGFDAYGATFGVTGISGGEVEAKETASPWFAARYRRYLGTWGFATDVSLGFAGGPAAEVAIGWADVLAITAGLNRYELEAGGRDTVASVGFRIGAVTIGGLFYVTALVATSAR